jgi:hypothetical protein
MYRTSLEKNIENREKIIHLLRKEFIGEGPYIGEEIDCTNDVSFDDEEKVFIPYVQKGTKEEIIQRETPLKTYGTAILFPAGNGQEYSDGIDFFQSENNEETNLFVDPKELEKLEKKDFNEKEEDQDFDISTANTYRPSSMALSFRAEINDQLKVIINVSGARYIPKKIKIKDKEWEWWLRQPINVRFECPGKVLCTSQRSVVVDAEMVKSENLNGLNLQVKIISRPQKDGTSLLTVCLINRTESLGNEKLDSLCLFQSAFNVFFKKDDKILSSILPYPEGENFDSLDDEEKSIALLYRNNKTFAIGHGCSADWGEVNENKVSMVKTEFIPTYETKSMTPDIRREDGSEIKVSMKDLAGLNTNNDGFSQLEEIIKLYRSWIQKQRERVHTLDPKFHKVANNNLNICEECADRMENGLNYIKSDPDALKAFQLANHAILLQQISGTEKRIGEIGDGQLVFNKSYKEPNFDQLPKNKGNWRAFQIAFILMSIISAGEKDSEERDIVDLIWFPTGGGKTEAYLGLAAFSMFMRRIKNPDDTGVEVLMRYTLRLLTADQFQRSSRLICAMEYLRQQHVDLLGTEEFSIGIWLGSDTTPNTNDEALKVLRKIKRGNFEDNPFILNSCPWCGAKLGEYKVKNSKAQSNTRGRMKKRKNNEATFLGYKELGDRVEIYCPDHHCPFHNHLPVYLVDEDIYIKRPTLIIGTVDKFALLAWRSDIRSIFGINNNGERDVSPPGLIIQDELHLISGPLGSMTGFFETIVDELCTERIDDKEYKPKIVCSTATIRRYKEQVTSLYARKDVKLFPPPALDEDDSFFATYAVDEEGNYLPGRKYVGIHTPILGSMQTLQVRSFTTLLQAPMNFKSMEERDPWWTLLVFFNSLRELGTTITLLHSDIPNHFKVLQKRYGWDYDEIRKIRRIEELTSRLSNDEVSVAIDKLKQEYDDIGNVIDICLASNIIEVGVDIDRLSLMTVVGQPKTTAQYIQVTGRVGRRWFERPGLIVTLYSATKPRDRSHFEKFRSYHQKLYSQVEPTSVTPFSPRVVDRALHAIMVAYVRQFGKFEYIHSPRPFPEELIDAVKEIIMRRVKRVDSNEAKNVEQVFEKLKEHWKKFEPLHWSGHPEGEDYPLLRLAGQYVDQKMKRRSWPTMMSMRNVDAQCVGKITDLYVEMGEY